MDESFDRIRDTYEKGDLPAVLALTKRYLVRRPDDGRAWELAGLIQFATGDFPKSVAAIERASVHIPLRPGARVCLGHGYGKIGRRKRAISGGSSIVDNSSLRSRSAGTNPIATDCGPGPL